MKYAREAYFTVPVEKAEELLKKMLRCVSEVDCYKELWCDDTGRMNSFHFVNGETLEYRGIFCYDNVHTVAIIREFS